MKVNQCKDWLGRVPFLPVSICAAELSASSLTAPFLAQGASSTGEQQLTLQEEEAARQTVIVEEEEIVVGATETGAAQARARAAQEVRPFCEHIAVHLALAMSRISTSDVRGLDIARFWPLQQNDACIR